MLFDGETNTETRNSTNGDIIYTDDSKGISIKIVVNTENDFLKGYPIVFLILSCMMLKLAIIGNILKSTCENIISEVRERLQENFIITRKPANIENKKRMKGISKKMAELLIAISLEKSQHYVKYGHHFFIKCFRNYRYAKGMLLTARLSNTNLSKVKDILESTPDLIVEHLNCKHIIVDTVS